MNTTDDWITWADDERLIPSVGPAPDEGACSVCYGIVGPLREGGYFPRCANCAGYGDLRIVVPIVYSLSDGLESLLHQYKDFGEEHRWICHALGSLVYEFLNQHLPCITQRVGEIHRFAIVPSGNAGRDFNPLRTAVDRVVEWPFAWELDLVTNPTGGRPGRGEVEPGIYKVARDVKDQTILVLDDTWTSGSSLASVAAALREAGARRVVGVPMGRQLATDNDFGSSALLLALAKSRGWSNGRCVLC